MIHAYARLIALYERLIELSWEIILETDQTLLQKALSIRHKEMVRLSEDIEDLNKVLDRLSVETDANSNCSVSGADSGESTAMGPTKSRACGFRLYGE